MRDDLRTDNCEEILNKNVKDGVPGRIILHGMPFFLYIKTGKNMRRSMRCRS